MDRGKPKGEGGTKGSTTQVSGYPGKIFYGFSLSIPSSTKRIRLKLAKQRVCEQFSVSLSAVPRRVGEKKTQGEKTHLGQAMGCPASSGINEEPMEKGNKESMRTWCPDHYKKRIVCLGFKASRVLGLRVGEVCGEHHWQWADAKA